MDATLLLVGCGKMGSALVGGWIDCGVAAERITVIEPVPSAAAAAAGLGVRLVDGLDALAADFQPDVIVFAVKPQVMDQVVPPYRRFAPTGAVFLSIAAGVTRTFLEARLGADAAIVRVMPNTPAAVRRGISVASANQSLPSAKRALCDRLLAAVGEVMWIDDEGLMDAVTAVSGSGPAYVFLLIECLAQAGVEAGLPKDMADRLARATVAGSGELARLDGASAATLRANVTSPGGTTAAALDVLMAEDGLQQLMSRAVAAAARRSRELAG